MDTTVLCAISFLGGFVIGAIVVLLCVAISDEGIKDKEDEWFYLKRRKEIEKQQR